MKNSTDLTDKRDGARNRVNESFDDIHEFVAEYATNLSRSGVFIRTHCPLPVGSKVDLKFSVILDDLEIFEAEGEVIRIEENAGFTGMGVAFTKLPKASQELLERVELHRNHPSS